MGKLGDVNYDGLITGLIPATFVGAGVLRKLGAEATYERGTVLAKSDQDNKLVILGTTAAQGETLVPYAVLCEETTVGTSADVNAPVYLAGCFNPNKFEVASGYTITEADKDTLRMNNIYLAEAL